MSSPFAWIDHSDAHRRKMSELREIILAVRIDERARVRQAPLGRLKLRVRDDREPRRRKRRDARRRRLGATLALVEQPTRAVVEERVRGRARLASCREQDSIKASAWKREHAVSALGAREVERRPRASLIDRTAKR